MGSIVSSTSSTRSSSTLRPTTPALSPYGEVDPTKTTPDHTVRCFVPDRPRARATCARARCRIQTLVISGGSAFRHRVRTTGITKVAVTAPRSPWQTSYIERLIGSIRRECLDHVIIFNEQHLRSV